MNDKELIFEQRLNRINTAVSHQEPDHVPVVFNAETWNISYSGLKTADLENNAQKEYECFCKPFQEIYCDATLFSCLTRDLRIYDRLGGGAYFISSDGVTIQHKEYVFMKDDEYPKLIKDPLSFTVDEIYSRKYPNLNKPYPQNLEALKGSLAAFGGYIQRLIGGAQYARENYGMPSPIGSIGNAPFDLIMDYYRGFKGIMCDVRRHPEELKEATEALIPMIMANITQGRPSLEPYPYLFFPLHAPSFLSKKQFEELYWPSFRKVLYQTADLGGKALVYLEGNWEHLYDFVNDFPKDFAIAMIEKDDIINAKKKIGNTVALFGGMDLALLRSSSKQECLDHTKKIIDECAPGGGYIFSTDKSLLAPGDVKIENLVAVNEFAHSYGKY